MTALPSAAMAGHPSAALPGTSIFGGGNGGSGGGLNCDEPGGSICAEAVFTTTRAVMTAPMQILTIDFRFIDDMS